MVSCAPGERPPNGRHHVMGQGLAPNDPLEERDPMIGRTVADRFIVQARIGSGGMGTVYKAV